MNNADRIEVAAVVREEFVIAAERLEEASLGIAPRLRVSGDTGECDVDFGVARESQIGGLLRFLGEVRSTLGSQNCPIVGRVNGRGAGPWLGSHGTGRECRHPEADGADMLAQVARALA